MFEWSGFGQKHLNFIKTPIAEHKKITILRGAIRSGKTTAMMTKWLEYLAYMPNHLKLIGGVSKDTVYDNVLSGMFEFFEHFGIRYNYNHSTGMLKVEIEPNVWSHCKIVGAEKAGSEKKIRGKTIAGAYIDELTLINYRFFKELLGRCSVKGAKIFCTTNPDSIDHWYKKEFGEDNPDVERISFTIDDNNTLPEDYKTFIKRQYKGAFYARMIEGLDVVAEGLVYDTFNHSKHTCNHEQILKMIENYEFKDYVLGCDWGWQDPTAVGLYGVTRDKTYYMIDELYKNHIEADEVSKWILEKQKEYKIFIRCGNFENARPELNYKVQKQTNIMIRAEKPMLEDSIGLMRSVINFDRLIINKDKCPYFLSEISIYRYPDEDERMKAGVKPDVPIDANQHILDATRYMLYYYETYFY